MTYWSENVNRVVKIEGHRRDDSRTRTPEKDQAQREYWSTYWRKRNHIQKGCACW